MAKIRTKVSYTNYGNFPDMDTLKEIILYGAKNGGDKKHLVFNSFKGDVQEKCFRETFYEAEGIGQYLYVNTYMIPLRIGQGPSSIQR